MLKIILSLTISLFINFIFSPSSFSQTEEETLTITTYYPASYGVYNEMRAKRMAVGTNYYNGSAYPWDTGGGCTGNEICNADLVVQGNVGIGTTSPDYKLSFGPDAGGASNILAFVDEASPNNAMRGIGGYNSGGVYGLAFWASLGDAATISNTRMFIDANTGNVGIGTTAFPADAGGLTIAGHAASSPNRYFIDLKRTDQIEAGGGIRWRGSNDSILWQIAGQGAGTPGIYFKEGTSNSMVIRNGGNVGIGTVNAVSHLTVTGGNGDANGFLLLSDSSANPSAGNRRAIYVCGTSLCFNNGVNVATINSLGNWVDASDISIKKDIQDLSKYGLSTVMRLKPREYKMKAGGEGQIGFIAQEVNEIIPEVVSGEQGSKGLAYGHLTAVLAKAIQEQQREIEELREKLASLEAEN